MPSRFSRLLARSRLDLIAIATGSLVTAGCATDSLQVAEKGGNEPADSSLMALGTADADGFLMQELGDLEEPASTEDLVNQAAADLERLLGQGGRARPPARVASADGGSVALSDNGKVDEASASLSTLAEAMPGAIAAPDPYILRQANDAWEQEGARVGSRGAPAASGEPVTKNDRLLAMASKLAALLRETGPDGKPAFSAEAALGTIEALSPGAVKTLDQEGSVLRAGLSALDFETLNEARLRASSGMQVSGPQLREVIEAVKPSRAELRIADARLCTRVMGFGRYEEITGAAFRAGKAARAIVYTELDGFEARPAQKSDPLAKDADVTDQVSVELEQSLTLYQDADGYQAWHRPAQRVIETSRSRRRDFYLIQIIDLPAALTIGKYNLKIAVRDATSGNTSERVIPVEIVAGS